MTGPELRKARESLGLSINQLATLLEMRPDTLRHMEMPEHMSSAEPVGRRTKMIVQSYLDGYRPKGWPCKSS